MHLTFVKLFGHIFRNFLNPPQPEKIGTYFEWNYVKPWCRFSPYIVGLILGYFLHITKNKQFKMNRVSAQNTFKNLINEDFFYKNTFH